MFCHGLPNGEYVLVFALVLVFVFRGRVYFCWLELVELFWIVSGCFTLYVTFLALATFVLPCWDIHVKGSIFFYVSCFKLLIEIGRAHV